LILCLLLLFCVFCYCFVSFVIVLCLLLLFCVFWKTQTKQKTQNNNKRHKTITKDTNQNSVFCYCFVSFVLFCVFCYCFVSFVIVLCLLLLFCVFCHCFVSFVLICVLKTQNNNKRHKTKQKTQNNNKRHKTITKDTKQ
jgi:quinol-cytochrome oxidoreductase complex cytochrome b subunit